MTTTTDGRIYWYWPTYTTNGGTTYTNPWYVSPSVTTAPPALRIVKGSK